MILPLMLVNIKLTPKSISYFQCLMSRFNGFTGMIKTRTYRYNHQQIIAQQIVAQGFHYKPASGYFVHLFAHLLPALKRQLKNFKKVL